jgi:hypothetical protein
MGAAPCNYALIALLPMALAAGFPAPLSAIF